ncbi:hypothetical protein Tco_1181536 [Tanacetum coccineum]
MSNGLQHEILTLTPELGLGTKPRARLTRVVFSTGLLRHQESTRGQRQSFLADLCINIVASLSIEPAQNMLFRPRRALSYSDGTVCVSPMQALGLWTTTISTMGVKLFLGSRFRIPLTSSYAEEMDSLISELANVNEEGKALVEECGNLLEKTHTLQAEEMDTLISELANVNEERKALVEEC